MKQLYHYTSLDHLQEILSDKVIKTTCSNLFRPINARIEKGNCVSDTDNIKPVVWFTDKILDEKDNGSTLGISGSLYDKTECAIVILNPTPNKYKKWSDWAIANNTDKEWFEALKKTAPDWESFYICEKPVKIDNNVRVYFRPDVYNQLKKENEESLI